MRRRPSRRGGSQRQRPAIDTSRLARLWRPRLLAGLVAACVMWAIAMTVFAAYVFRDMHHRLERLQDDYQRSEAELHAQIQEANTERLSLQRDLTSSQVIHEELGVLFQQLIFEKHRPRDGGALMSGYDRLFYQVSGRILTDEERRKIMRTTNQMWGDGTTATKPKAVDPRPPRPQDGPRAGDAPKGPVSVAPPSRTTDPVKPPPPKGQVYRNQAYRFTAVFPEDWAVRDEAEASAVMASSPRKDLRERYVAYVRINSVKLRLPRELEEFSDEQVEEMRRQHPDFKAISSGALVVAGRPARFVECTYTRAGTPFHGILIHVVRKEFAYDFSFSTTEEKYPDFRQRFTDIYNSVKFL